MPDPLKIDEFLAPIPGGDPAGDELPYDLKKKLDDARKVVPEGEPGVEAKKADWAGVVNLAEEVLKEKSKDLLVAVRMTEALAHTRGFDGLADGLALLGGLLDRCWDRLHPVVEGGDLDGRIGRVNWLCEPTAGAQFPRTVRGIPLFVRGGTPVSLFTWAEPGGADGKEAVDKAVAAATPAECQAAVAAADRAVAALDALAPVLETRFGPELAPSLTDLREAVGKSRDLADELLQKKVPGGGAKAAATTDDKKGGGTQAVGPAGGTRPELLDQMDHLAAAFERLEPHSPVPAVVRYAVALGRKNYRELMEELILDDAVRAALFRQVGVKT